MSRFKFFSALLFLFVVLSTMIPQAVDALGFSDKPQEEGGDGFIKGDECGYLQGISSDAAGLGLYVNAAEVIDPRDQACVDRNGYFYRHDGDLSNPHRESYAYMVIREGADGHLLMDFAWEATGTQKYVANVDPTTGEWSGYAVLRKNPLPSGFSAGELLPGKQWVWFDWTCADLSGGAEAACTEEEAARYRVKTDLVTGEVSGYAWNDQYGFIPFGGGYLSEDYVGLSMEMQPHGVDVYVDVLAGDTDLGVNEVDLSTAPIADGYDYWRVRVQFWDSVTGEPLTEDDLVDGSFEVSPVNADIADMFLNQIENTGNPIKISKANSDFGCTEETAAYCSVPEQYGADGEYDELEGDTPWSANAFIYSGAPTSDMLGVDTDADEEVNHFSDREGCRWIYKDQWYELDRRGMQPDCPIGSGQYFFKEDVFYDRMSSRNMIGINGVFLNKPAFSESLYFFNDSDASIAPKSGGYVYLPNFNGDGNEDGENDAFYMSFRPRFVVEKFVADYDGGEYTHISEDRDKNMVLELAARVSAPSEPAQVALEALSKVGSVDVKPDITVYYQTAVSHSTPATNDSLYLIMDTETAPAPLDCARRTDVWNGEGDLFTRNVALGYGQKSAVCLGAGEPDLGPVPVDQTLSNPTAEQWVCDSVTSSVPWLNGAPSCYFTAYMDIVDRHAEEAEPMKVLGAINSILNDESVFDNSEEVSILGSTDSIALRNKMYAQVVRYSLGQDTASSGSLDDKMNPSAGLLTLMDGRLIVARGDVTIEGMSSEGAPGFSDKTLVVIGGNVYIERNIYGGRLGVIAFQDGGWGGNVYIAPAVSDLYVNFFLDGALYSYDGSTRFEREEGFDYAHVPTWMNEETRLSALKNQLYINGSISSHNTVNGAVVEPCEGVCIPGFSVGDGNLVDASGLVDYDPGAGVLTGYEIAREHDLTLFRQYRLCYPLGDDGRPNYDAEPDQVCGDDGAQLSSYGSDENLYNSLILEYATADRLPIFRSQDGLFN